MVSPDPATVSADRIVSGPDAPGSADADGIGGHDRNISQPERLPGQGWIGGPADGGQH